ncbi:MAG: TolC family protein, partial [Ferruginibacter sp.]
MFKLRIHTYISILGACIALASCKVPTMVQRAENRSVPQSYNNKEDTANAAIVDWRTFFKDKVLVSLIDTAIQNNQELN